MKFFVYTLAGSAFLFVGILALAFLHRSQVGGPLTFSLTALSATHLSGTTGVLLLCAFTVAFVVKAPIFPFHTWSPDAYSEAPVAGSVVLAALLAKLGTYGILRFDITLFPHALATAAPWLLGLAIASILYGALVACGSSELKRLLAYSSLAQMGFIVLGTVVAQRDGRHGRGAPDVQPRDHHRPRCSCSSGSSRRAPGTSLVTSLRGLQGPAPVLAALLHRGDARVDRPARAERLRRRVPRAPRLLRRPRLVGHPADARRGGRGRSTCSGRTSRPSRDRRSRGPRRSADLDLRERAVLAPLIAIMVVLGVYPKLVIDRIQPSVVHLLAHLHPVATLGHP